MLSKNQIKHINSLQIKKFRQQFKAFVVEGEKNVNELLSSGLEIKKILATNQWLQMYHSLIPLRNFDFQEITENELRKISDLTKPNLVLAIGGIPDAGGVLPTDFKKTMIALDGIRDPGNLGTIIRTADWFGIETIICSNDSVDVYNPKVIQATMGSFARISVIYTDLAEFFTHLEAETPVYGALLKGKALTEKLFTKPGIILIGNESHGISPTLMPFINEPIYIPRISGSDSRICPESLNASIANGIICYEICKQLLK